ALVSGPRLDRAPADGLAVEVRDQSAGRLGAGMAALGLRAQPVGALLHREVVEGLAPVQLEALALASGRRPALAEDRLQVLPARLVRRDDGDRHAAGV